MLFRTEKDALDFIVFVKENICSSVEPVVEMFNKDLYNVMKLFKALTEEQIKLVTKAQSFYWTTNRIPTISEVTTKQVSLTIHDDILIEQAMCDVCNKFDICVTTNPDKDECLSICKDCINKGFKDFDK